MHRIIATIALLLTLAADSLPSPRYLIYFLGDREAPSKNAYVTLQKVLRQTQAELAEKLWIEYLEIPAPGPALNAFLQRAAVRRPQMVVALSGPEAIAARDAFVGVPIVFTSFEEPLEQGVVSNAQARPEPVCGISLADTLEGKRFEILRLAFPGVRRVGVLADRQWADVMGGRPRTEREAARQGLRATVYLAEDQAQVQAVLQAPESAGLDAWYVPATPISDHSGPVIIERLRAWKKPSIWTSPEEVGQGAPLAYAQETGFVWRSLVDLIARVHGGERPGDIPILRPTRFTLSVRVEAASPVPAPQASIVRQADQVIR